MGTVTGSSRIADTSLRMQTAQARFRWRTAAVFAAVIVILAFVSGLNQGVRGVYYRSLAAAAAVALVSLFLRPMSQLGSAHSPNRQAETTEGWVKMAYCGAAPEKPQLEKLFFDVWVHNPTQEQSWVLLPLGFYQRPTSYNNDHGISAIQVLAAKIKQLKLVRFRGRFRIIPDIPTDAGGSQGILLPGGATVFVHNLIIEFWGRPNRPLPITPVLAREITVGGEVVQHHLRIPLQSNTISPAPLSLVESWHTNDRGELPAVIMKTAEFTITNALAKACDPRNVDGK